MKIRKITYPTPLENISDIKNDNIDVFVESEEGRNYTLTVCTPQFYYTYMEKEKIDFLPAAPPDIIVKVLTDDIIKRTLKTYCENNGYWLKLFHLAGINKDVFSIESMDKMFDDMEKDWEQCD